MRSQTKKKNNPEFQNPLFHRPVQLACPQIKANIYAISKLVNSHIMQIREEVQFGGRTDFSLTYKGKKTVIEFKIARKKELDQAGKEGEAQLAKYKGDQKVLVVIDKDSWEIECHKIF